MRSALVVALWMVLAVPVSLAQNHQVSGTVTNAKTGMPLPGVNVVVKGTIVGTATDADGTYQLTVPSPTDTLVFSFVGYKTEEAPVRGRSTIDVQLREDTAFLDEVVVLGYSAKDQRQIPSAVVEVSAEELEGVTTGDATTMLQGKVAGVYITNGSGSPGSAPSIRIRGTGSISAGASPLYVVDGIIVGGGVGNSTDPGEIRVDPDDIKTITILKDAAATALYGSRAANGVVVITTKSGRPGETRVNISSSVGFNYRTQGRFEVMNARQLYAYQQLMGQTPPYFSEDLLNQNTDWPGLVFRRGLTSTLDASVSGGNQNTTYYISGGYYREQGTVVSTGLDRFSGRVNLEHRVNEDLTVTARAYGEYQTQTHNPTGALYQAYTNLPWDDPYKENGEPRTGNEPEWIGRESASFLYPLQYNWTQSKSQYFGADLKLAYDFTDWLSFTTTNRATFDYWQYEAYDDPRTSAGSTYGGDLNNARDYESFLLTSNLLHLSKAFGEHTFGGLLGFEYQKNYYDGISGTGVGIFSGLETLDVTAEALGIGGSKSESAFVSGFFQADYNYKHKYYVTVSFRRDGSSRFGGDNRFGNFYSVGGSWIVSGESFMDGLPQVDFLKLRASYGTTGNAQIDDYIAQGLYSYSVQYDGRPGSIPSRLASPNLTWEVSHMLNVGMEVGLFERIDLTVDLYRRLNESLLLQVPLPATSGYDSRIQNIGTVRNRGLEVALSTTNLTGPITWTTDFNIGFNRNEVIKLYQDNYIPNGLQRIKEGWDLRTWYMREWAGVDPKDGDPLWVKLVTDENGNVVDRVLTNDYNEATLQPVGTASPDFTGGLRNTLRYKGFTLDVFVNFVYGRDIYHSARELFDSDGAYPTYNQMVLLDEWSRWQEPGDQATHPKVVYGGNQLSNKPSSRYLEDGSYLRLQNVTLSYELPQSLVQGLGLRSLDVYISGDNLLTLTEFSGMDPQVGLGGYAGTQYPISRRILFGVEVGL